MLVDGVVGLSSVTTAGANSIALTVGVAEGVGDCTAVTGHVAATAGIRGIDPFPAVCGAPLCAEAPVGMTSKPETSIRP
jgi:hypothetical protein